MLLGDSQGEVEEEFRIFWMTFPNNAPMELITFALLQLRITARVNHIFYVSYSPEVYWGEEKKIFENHFPSICSDVQPL